MSATGSERGPKSGGETRSGRQGWVAVAVVREAILRLHHAYGELPRRVRQAWWKVMTGGFFLCLGWALVLVWLGRRLQGSGALAWERGVLRWFDAEAPLSFNTAMWMEGIGNGFVLWGMVLLAAGVAAWKRLPLLCLSFLVGYTGVYLLIATAWAAWERERPTLIAGGIGSPTGFFHSYPSGHMVQAAVAYGIPTYLWMRAARSPMERLVALVALALVLTVVGIGRLRVGAHWPSDLVAGTLIGGAWTLVVVAALRRAEAAGNDPRPEAV